MRVNWMLVGGLLVTGAAVTAGTAVAASISPTSNIAGRGTNTNTGFATSDLNYGTTANSPTSLSPLVSSVTFTLRKTVDSAFVTSSDTIVYAQLMGATYGNWASCSIGGSGVVTCTLTGSQRLTIDSVTGTNVVAYDQLGN